jgi:hypothetical protein
MIFGARVLAYVIRPVANWNRSSFFWGMYPFKRPNVI